MAGRSSGLPGRGSSCLAPSSRLHGMWETNLVPFLPVTKDGDSENPLDVPKSYFEMQGFPPPLLSSTLRLTRHLSPFSLAPSYVFDHSRARLLTVSHRGRKSPWGSGASLPG